MSTSKRPAILLGILLLLLAAYFGWNPVKDVLRQAASDPVRPPPPPVKLPAANAFNDLKVAVGKDGIPALSLHYDYTGQPANARLMVFQRVHTNSIGSTAPTEYVLESYWLRPGSHTVSFQIRNPNPGAAYVTEAIGATLEAPPLPAERKVVEHRIQWPDPIAAEVEAALAAGHPEQVVQKAVRLIDDGTRETIALARRLLQELVEKSPRTDAAYVELARVAMKTNWGPTGLRDAEKLIGSALQIRPDSVDAKILLGYVQAHQGRYKEAEAMFAQAAAANPPNLWLWANWGEALAMQDKVDQAIARYREAITRPPTSNTYDRARWDAYEKLLVLLERRSDIDGMQALLQQQAREYPNVGCFAVDYARFLLLQRADIQQAVATLRDSPSPGCDPAQTRQVQGLGYYVAWAGTQAAEGADALRQARVFAPVGPELFYMLASSDKGSAVAQKLVAAGESVGVRDDREFDALAYALRSGNIRVARRLLRLGANPAAEVGPEKMPAALIPVLTRDFDSIRLLQRSGVDYRKLRYQGTTAIEYARQQQDAKLQNLLDPKAGTL